MTSLASIWSLGTVAFTGFFAIAFGFFFFVIVPLRVVLGSRPRRQPPERVRASRELTAQSLAS